MAKREQHPVKPMTSLSDQAPPHRDQIDQFEVCSAPHPSQCDGGNTARDSFLQSGRFSIDLVQTSF